MNESGHTCRSLCFRLPLCLLLPHSLCLCLRIFPSASLFLSLSPSLPFGLTLSVSDSLFLCLSPSSVSIQLWVCVQVAKISGVEVSIVDDWLPHSIPFRTDWTQGWRVRQTIEAAVDNPPVKAATPAGLSSPQFPRYPVIEPCAGRAAAAINLWAPPPMPCWCI